MHLRNVIIVATIDAKHKAITFGYSVHTMDRYIKYIYVVCATCGCKWIVTVGIHVESQMKQNWNW